MGGDFFRQYGAHNRISRRRRPEKFFQRRAQNLARDDDRRDRIAGHTEQRLVTDAAQHSGFSRHDIDTVRQQLSRLGDDVRRQIVLSRRRTGDNGYDIAFFGCPAHRLHERVHVVACARIFDRRPAPLAHEARKNGGIEIDHCARLSFFARLDQLVSRRNDADFRPGFDAHSGMPGSQQRA